MQIHLLYEIDEEEPDLVLGTNDASAVPAMLEAWFARHAESRFGGFPQSVKDEIRATLAEKLRLDQTGLLVPVAGGLTYAKIASFTAPAADGQDTVRGRPVVRNESAHQALAKLERQCDAIFQEIATLTGTLTHDPGRHIGLADSLELARLTGALNEALRDVEDAKRSLAENGEGDPS